MTDGWGEPLDDRLLLGSGHDFQMSSISAANADLHEQLVREIDAGIERLQSDGEVSSAMTDPPDPRLQPRAGDLPAGRRGASAAPAAW